MHKSYSPLLRLLAVTLILATLFLTGCSKKTPAPQESTTAPTEAPQADPTTPSTDPNDPPEPTAHQKLFDYLDEKGAVTVEESMYTFTMSAQNGDILLEYKNDSTHITVTMKDGAEKFPVNITFGIYTATAVVDVATYTNMEYPLSQFYCGVPAMLEPLMNMSKTAVKNCFTQAARAMEPSGVNLVDLGFVKYYG